jgi:hypothetical protein
MTTCMKENRQPTPTEAEPDRYVHEYGEIGAPLYAGRVFIECLDSPPVLPGPFCPLPPPPSLLTYAFMPKV